jgi:hypothetical protein
MPRLKRAVQVPPLLLLEHQWQLKNATHYKELCRSEVFYLHHMQELGKTLRM